MATFTLRRFSDPDALRSIALENLIELLTPHTKFFADRGFNVPRNARPEDFDYEGLIKILMNPGSDTPVALSDALYVIHEMAVQEEADDLLDELQSKGVIFGSHPSPYDIAVKAWLFSPDLLEKKHAECFLTKPKSFECFQTYRDPIPAFETPSTTRMKSLKQELDDWLESKKRDRTAKILTFPKDDGIWFLVRHGELFKRDGAVKGDQSESVYYRPEKHDVIHYNPTIGEIRIHACSEKEKELYRRQFGKHIFGDENFFPGESKYTLDPLRNDGSRSLVCTDVTGLDWIKLKELHIFWGGAEGESEVRKASDLFKALEARDREIPKHGNLLRAGFLVKFTDAKTPRTVVIRPPNIALYSRDGDGILLEEFLTKRGFIKSRDKTDGVEKHEEVAMVGA